MLNVIVLQNLEKQAKSSSLTVKAINYFSPDW